MRSLLVVISIAVSMSAWADLPTVHCGACRSVYDHPRDFGNYTFNEVLGDTPSLSLFEGSRVKVVNPQGEWAVVDLAFVLEQTGLSLSILVLSYSVIVPDGTILIRVLNPAGYMTEYDVFAEAPDLLVGDGSEIAESAPDPEPEQPAPVTPNKSPGGLDLLGGYDASANYFGGATIPYYDFRLMNE